MGTLLSICNQPVTSRIEGRYRGKNSKNNLTVRRTSRLLIVNGIFVAGIAAANPALVLAAS
jgi:hypothetical protein